MNNIILQGIIKNIQPSHITNDIEYYKANLIVKREDGKEDIINLKFKRFSNPYKENDEISLIGNVRTYSQKFDNHNSVEVYVFTYMDKPEEDFKNLVLLDGRICKKNDLRKTKTGKDVLDFIIANNIITENQSINCYIPIVAWGKLAKEINKLDIGTKIQIEGQLHSREYKKKIADDDFEIRIAHEININKLLESE